MKGVTLGWIVNPQGQRVYGIDKIARLIDLGVEVARFAFDLGGHTTWDATISGIYQDFLGDLAAARIAPLGLVSNGAVPGPRNQQADWNQGNREIAGGNGSNQFQKAYTQSLGALVAAFAGQVPYWELWNEPNAYSASVTTPSGATAYSGSSFMYPSCYAALLVQAAPLVPAGATLITGGLFAHGTDKDSSGAQYLFDVWSQGGWTSYNSPIGPPPRGAIGVHLYPNNAGPLDPRAPAAILMRLRDALAWYENPSRRAPRDFYVTEAGWQSDAVGSDLQAANLATLATALSYLPGVPLWSWYSDADNPGARQTYGLYDVSGLIKESGTMYKAV